MGRHPPPHTDLEETTVAQRKPPAKKGKKDPMPFPPKKGGKKAPGKKGRPY